VKSMDESRFENFLIEKGDAIDSAAYQLAIALLMTRHQDNPEEILPWNMEILGEIIAYMESVLKKRGYIPCYPYHEDDIMCPETDSCSKPDCPFKESEEGCK